MEPFFPRFLDRQRDLQVIEQRLIAPVEPGNLSIVGLPRIGKSSLLLHALTRREAALAERGIVLLSVNLAEYTQSIPFFQSLVQRCRQKMEAFAWATPAMQRAADDALRGGLSWNEGYSRVQRFFHRARREKAGMRILCTLDEFDAAANLFAADPADLLRLRSLSDNPSWRVTFITLSERPLRVIEAHVRGASGAPSSATLHPLFREHYVGMFDAPGMQEYFAQLAAAGIPVSKALEERVVFYAGGHPWLLALLARTLLEPAGAQSASDVDAAFEQCEADFLAYFKQLVGQPDNLSPIGRTLQQAMMTRSSARTDEMDILFKYGLLQRAASGEPELFSQRFQAFFGRYGVSSSWVVEEDDDADELPEGFWPVELEEDEQETQYVPAQPGSSLWELWRETERGMRRALAAMLREKYGEGWYKHIQQLYPNLGEKHGISMYQRCNDSWQREVRNWGERPFDSMLEFSAPQDLFELLHVEWETFKPLFGKDIAYWRGCAQLLAEVRVLLAHNREEALRDDERTRASSYCEEIITILRDWRETTSAQEASLWPLWMDTERRLRGMVAFVLERTYGRRWFERIEQRYARGTVESVKDLCQRWRNAQRRETAVFGARQYETLLDFAYPQELFALIFSAEWEAFRPIFGEDWFYWLPRAQFFARLRNPLAHHRDEAIVGENRRLAVEYCVEIQDVLRAYLDTLQQGDMHA